MGIPSYFSYIVKNYPHILSKFVSRERAIDNLYLDCNSILYDVYHRLVALDKAEKSVVPLVVPLSDRIIQGTIHKIHEYIELVGPRKTIYIAFDGVAPVAKIDQQRSRRYKSWYQSEVTKHIYATETDEPKKNSNKTNINDDWSTLAITPGTNFMNQLDVQINLEFASNRQTSSREIIVGGSRGAGEGEHKLFDYIRQNPEKHKNETTVVYGLDADLIVLSICHLNYSPNLFLFRESPHFHMENLDPNANYLLDINRLAQVIDIDTHDYIVLTFLLGNDFLPHFPALNIRTGGMDKLLIAYRDLFTKDIKAHLTLAISGKQTIHWLNMHRFIAVLSKMEEKYIQEEHKLRNRREYVFPERTADERFKKFESTPTFDRTLEKYISPFHQNWQQRYYASLFPRSSTSNLEKKDLVKDVVQNYCEGLEWNLQYYTHSCPDWRWTYKYSYPPLLQDFHAFLENACPVVILNGNNKPFSQLTQLCCVLPKAGLKYLPVELQTKLLENHSRWYDTNCRFLWAYCRYFWESHVVMEHIDMKAMETLINETKLKNKYE